VQDAIGRLPIPLKAASRFGRLLAGALLATAHLLALTASHFSKRGAMLLPEFVRRKLASPKKLPVSSDQTPATGARCDRVDCTRCSVTRLLTKDRQSLGAHAQIRLYIDKK
jgi:hypothetical protein